jgi:hypothetical protein
MELKMFIGDILIDSIPISPTYLENRGRLYALQAQLEEKNEDILDLSRIEPSFLIDSVPSRINNQDKGPVRN